MADSGDAATAGVGHLGAAALLVLALPVDALYSAPVEWLSNTGVLVGSALLNLVAAAAALPRQERLAFMPTAAVFLNVTLLAPSPLLGGFNLVGTVAMAGLIALQASSWLRLPTKHDRIASVGPERRRWGVPHRAAPILGSVASAGAVAVWWWLLVDADGWLAWAYGLLGIGANLLAVGACLGAGTASYRRAWLAVMVAAIATVTLFSEESPLPSPGPEMATILLAAVIVQGLALSVLRGRINDEPISGPADSGDV